MKKKIKLHKIGYQDLNTVKIDILEKLPIPFGLIRYGVAPDYSELKNVINTFYKVAINPHVKFVGNVTVGLDVIKDLENVNNVISPQNFVGWYNGVPENKNFKINLHVEKVVVIGQNNVAIDIARNLLTPVDKLKVIPLCHSKLRKVFMVGRRGPMQAAFMIAKLREILNLESCRTFWREQDFENIEAMVPTLDRTRKRQIELMLQSLKESKCDSMYTKELYPIFLRSPVEFLGDKKLEVAEMTGDFEEILCGLGLRSIGYKAVQIDNLIPFNTKKRHVENTNGKVEGNLYIAGWATTGSTDVLIKTMTNAFQVAKLIHNELSSNTTKQAHDWQRIDRVEQERGKRQEKVREKIVNVTEMLEIAENV
ncbi:NADPH:adrenodoxin oxidoreductase, mitochondrial-like [Cardiocondyla obscurior]|uniref:NADPH:adrenodoxin oxidoreductase, mitochondrial-like n=1 Tax=Cardiocondyla obscurior TaxID=286306 RepID=UPI00396561B7